MTIMPHRGWLLGLALLLAIQASRAASAQNNSLNQYGAGRDILTMSQGNIFRGLPMEPRRIGEHDKVTVRVEELARVQSDGDMQRRRNATINMAILDWIRLNGFRKAEPTQASGQDPRIQGELSQLYRAEADMETTERLTLNIACEVFDVRPNGHLVIGGQKEIRINDEVWLVSLSGICRQEDVGPDNVVLSQDLLNLKIHKMEQGHVRDGYRRGWGLKLLDQLSPF